MSLDEEGFARVYEGPHGTLSNFPPTEEDLDMDIDSLGEGMPYPSYLCLTHISRTRACTTAWSRLSMGKAVRVPEGEEKNTQYPGFKPSSDSLRNGEYGLEIPMSFMLMGLISFSH